MIVRALNDLADSRVEETDRDNGGANGREEAKAGTAEGQCPS
jgi:hypothetical protein